MMMQATRFVSPLSLQERLVQSVLLNLRPAWLSSMLKAGMGLSRRVIVTSEGTFLVDPYSNLGFRLSREGNYEPEMGKKLRALLRPGDVFVDLGANEGYFSVFAAKIVGPQGKVVAIEPQERLLGVIKNNLELNSCTNVILCNRAITDIADGVVNIHLAPDINTGSSGLQLVTRYRVPQQVVEATTLLRALENCAVNNRVDLLKVDIEGLEYEALLGSTELFRDGRVRAIALELHPEILAIRGKSSLDITMMLSGYGYRESTEFESVWEKSA